MDLEKAGKLIKEYFWDADFETRRNMLWAYDKGREAVAFYGDFVRYEKEKE